MQTSAAILPTVAPATAGTIGAVLPLGGAEFAGHLDVAVAGLPAGSGDGGPTVLAGAGLPGLPSVDAEGLGGPAAVVRPRFDAGRLGTGLAARVRAGVVLAEGPAVPMAVSPEGSTAAPVRTDVQARAAGIPGAAEVLPGPPSAVALGPVAGPVAVKALAVPAAGKVVDAGPVADEVKAATTELGAAPDTGAAALPAMPLPAPPPVVMTGAATGQPPLLQDASGAEPESSRGDAAASTVAEVAQPGFEATGVAAPGPGGLAAGVLAGPGKSDAGAPSVAGRARAGGSSAGRGSEAAKASGPAVAFKAEPALQPGVAADAGLGPLPRALADVAEAVPLAAPLSAGVAAGLPPAAPSHAPPAPAPPVAVAQAPPAAQIAPVFVALGAGSGPGAPQHLTIRLDPAELGRVQVRIERAAEGPAHVVLAVERSDTLMLLMQDRPQLNQALDAAGVPAEGRTLQFTLSPGGSGDPGGGSGGLGGGPGGQGGSPGQGGHRARDDPSPAPHARAAPPAWIRAGIDITA